MLAVTSTGMGISIGIGIGIYLHSINLYKRCGNSHNYNE